VLPEGDGLDGVVTAADLEADDVSLSVFGFDGDQQPARS
jgi:hypothetical protein